VLGVIDDKARYVGRDGGRGSVREEKIGTVRRIVRVPQQQAILIGLPGMILRHVAIWTDWPAAECEGGLLAVVWNVVVIDVLDRQPLIFVLCNINVRERNASPEKRGGAQSEA
jgi:hypothetical protein